MVKRLMRHMGMHANYPKKKLSKATPDYKNILIFLADYPLIILIMFGPVI